MGGISTPRPKLNRTAGILSETPSEPVVPRNNQSPVCLSLLGGPGHQAPSNKFRAVNGQWRRPYSSICSLAITVTQPETQGQGCILVVLVPFMHRNLLSQLKMLEYDMLSCLKGGENFNINQPTKAKSGISTAKLLNRHFR